MGADLGAAFPAARAVFEQADEVLGFSLSALCFDGPEEELKRTLNTQPAVFTVSWACLRAAQEAGGLPPAFLYALRLRLPTGRQAQRDRENICHPERSRRVIVITSYKSR